MARNLDEPGANFNQLLELSIKLENARTFASKPNGVTTLTSDDWDIWLQQNDPNYQTLEEEEMNAGGRVGYKDGRTVGNIVDVRNVPYYAGKGLQGLVNSAETLSKFPFAAGELGSKLIRQKPSKKMFMEAIENITPGSWSENTGLTSLIEGMEEKRSPEAKAVGNVLGLGTEIAVPTGGAFKAGQILLSKASKAMGKVKDGKTLNKLIDEKLTDSGQSRRDFNIMVSTSGLMVALKSIGLGGVLKGATKKLDDIEIQVRGDADYEYIDEGWSGATWANIQFKALSAKGKKILEDLTAKYKKQPTSKAERVDYERVKNTLVDDGHGFFSPGDSEDAAGLVEEIIKKHKPNWSINTATTEIYNPATKSFAHPKGSVKETYETTKNYSGKDLNKKTIMKEADDMIASEPSPYHRGIEVHDEYFDDILDQITVSKAKGGRIYGKYAQQLASGGRVGYGEGDIVPQPKPYTLEMFEKDSDTLLRGMYGVPESRTMFYNSMIDKANKLRKQGVDRETVIDIIKKNKFKIDEILRHQDLKEISPKRLAEGGKSD